MTTAPAAWAFVNSDTDTSRIRQHLTLLSLDTRWGIHPKPSLLRPAAFRCSVTYPRRHAARPGNIPDSIVVDTPRGISSICREDGSDHGDDNTHRRHVRTSRDGRRHRSGGLLGRMVRS